MSQINMYKCEGCGKVTENIYKEKGWIHLNADGSKSISRSTGIFEKNGYVTDVLVNVQDFCSLKCLMETLEKRTAEREAKQPPQPTCNCQIHGPK